MPDPLTRPSVLFVCTGNICRSPTAQALLLHKAAAHGIAIDVDSAALSGGVLGQQPDPRALAELHRRGVSMPEHCARLVTRDDFKRFERILGMTPEHVTALRQRAASGKGPVIDVLMRYADGYGAVGIPDPWYGDERDFVRAFDMIEAGVDGLLRTLSQAPAE